MKFSVITLFPEMIINNIRTSITGRAWQQGKFDLNTYQLRDFSDNYYGRIDDTLAGGGTGMLLQCEPIQKCIDKINEDSGDIDSGERKFIYLSPKGQVFNQKMAADLSNYKELVFLCGHYEGVDERVLHANDFMEISLGDYVLTAGEYGACILIDAIARLLPGVLPNREAYSNESHYNGVLEECQYTKPAKWRNQNIPEILLSGRHNDIKKWQKNSALYETALKRPDLFAEIKLSVDEYEDLIEFVANKDLK